MPGNDLQMQISCPEFFFESLQRPDAEKVALSQHIYETLFPVRSEPDRIAFYAEENIRGIFPDTCGMLINPPGIQRLEDILPPGK